eukprot:6393508-Pyramimonas_sp.AAC.1
MFLFGGRTETYRDGNFGGPLRSLFQRAPPVALLRLRSRVFARILWAAFPGASAGPSPIQESRGRAFQAPCGLFLV